MPPWLIDFLIYFPSFEAASLRRKRNHMLTLLAWLWSRVSSAFGLGSPRGFYTASFRLLRHLSLLPKPNPSTLQLLNPSSVELSRPTPAAKKIQSFRSPPPFSVAARLQD
jgi:hypothetical protein